MGDRCLGNLAFWLCIGLMITNSLEEQLKGWIKYESFLFRPKTKLYEQVSEKANTNNDSITDHQEWAKVYEKFGLKYDIHLSNPRYDLSTKQMKKYLENH